MRVIPILLLLLALPFRIYAQPRTTVERDVAIVVDPRIELMSIIQLLDDYMLISPYDSRYKDAAYSHFSMHADHDAVRLFSNMSQNRFNFDAVPKAILSLSPPPSLEPVRPFLPEVIRRAGSADSLDAFFRALRDFTAAAEFDVFLNGQSATYQRLIESSSSHVREAVDVLVEYTGMEPANSTIILGPLLHDGGFSATFDSGDKLEVYALLGPTSQAGEEPTFGSAERIGGLVWHELSHSIVNPLTAQYPREVEATRALFTPIAERMKRQAYPHWETALNEHIIRAITTRLIGREYGHDAGDNALRRELSLGFRYIQPLLEELKYYEENRSSYSSLTEFYPRLLDVFKSQTLQD